MSIFCVTRRGLVDGHDDFLHRMWLSSSASALRIRACRLRLDGTPYKHVEPSAFIRDLTVPHPA